jgi:3-hydroxyacyl-CoA dehydrogenase
MLGSCYTIIALAAEASAGEYGRKSGKGFYDYADPEKPKAQKL